MSGFRYVFPKGTEADVTGEKNLETLLSSMEPSLRDGIYVFSTLESEDVPSGLSPLGMFREDEGLTLILPEEEAARARRSA